MKRVMSNLVVVLAMLAMMFCVPSVATATLIVDQENVIDTSGSNWTADQLMQLTLEVYNQIAQTFTVGVTGTLSRVEVEAYHSSATACSVRVDLWRTTGAGVPDPSVSLANWFINDLNSTMTVGSFVSLNLDAAAAFPVSPGDVYAIVFSPVNLHLAGSGRYWVRGTPNPYAGGNSFYRTIDSSYNGLTSFQADPSDYGFRTFVDVPGAALPEPTTMLLLGLSLVGLIGMRRKMQR